MNFSAQRNGAGLSRAIIANAELLLPASHI
uniref:Uncharacterized protein n=1 Tax=Anguilla anguilla TaxID=7936 RepID=A0A0E9RFJ7_ANGAN